MVPPGSIYITEEELTGNTSHDIVNSTAPKAKSHNLRQKETSPRLYRLKLTTCGYVYLNKVGVTTFTYINDVWC